jgi:hypothetical protein
MATSAPVLSYYDPKKPVTLSVDASSKGLGAVLYQEEKQVAYASRALTPTQQKYAQIEKETLTIVFGTTKFHQFLFGKEVLVTSDHKPLEYIFNKPLHQAPLRLQKMLLALHRYELRIVYKPGRELFIADALSRNYLEETKETLVQELEVNEVHLTAHLPISPDKYQEFQKATANDVVKQAVQDAVLEGWPKNKVLHKHQSPRSYVIESEQRQKYRRTAVTCVPVNYQRKNRGVMLNMQTPKSRA